MNISPINSYNQPFSGRLILTNKVKGTEKIYEIASKDDEKLMKTYDTLQNRLHAYIAPFFRERYAEIKNVIKEVTQDSFIDALKIKDNEYLPYKQTFRENEFSADFGDLFAIKHTL